MLPTFSHMLNMWIIGNLKLVLICPLAYIQDLYNYCVCLMEDDPPSSHDVWCGLDPSGNFQIHELHGKGHKMPRAHGRRCNNKGARAEVALASFGLHALHEMWVVMAMKG